MSFLYQRDETSEKVEVKYRFVPLFYLALFVAIALSLISRGQWTNNCMGSFGILLIAWVIGLCKPIREINKAMKQGGVLVSGSKFSFTNPIKIVIKK